MRNTSMVLSLLMLMSIAFLQSCREDYDATQVAAIEFAFEGTQAPTSEKIEEIKQDILRNQDIINSRINAAGNVARLYTALGMEYKKFGMFQLAMGAFERAIETEQENAMLYYWAGLMAGQVSASLPDKKAEFLAKAKVYHARALSLRPKYTEALYAMAIISYFEDGDPEAAQAFISRILSQEPKHTKAMFLAGRIAAGSQDRDKALYWYGEILRIGTDETEKKQAKENQEALLAP